jgi:hypothetical protein
MQDPTAEPWVYQLRGPCKANDQRCVRGNACTRFFCFEAGQLTAKWQKRHLVSVCDRRLKTHQLNHCGWPYIPRRSQAFLNCRHAQDPGVGPQQRVRALPGAVPQRDAWRAGGCQLLRSDARALRRGRGARAAALRPAPEHPRATGSLYRLPVQCTCTSTGSYLYTVPTRTQGTGLYKCVSAMN